MDGIPTPQLARLVRQYRLHTELTQQELAERSGLSVRQISDLERGLRKQPHLHTIRMLADGLNLSGDHRDMLFAAARPDLHTDTGTTAESNGFLAAPPAWDHVLPTPANDLIGRNEAVERLIEELVGEKHRLITLTGSGGVGKTRLALEAASITRQKQHVDVVFMPLASIFDPGLVAPAIGRAFGLRGVDAQSLPERLAVELAGRRLLLVLDNFEQILQAAPLVSQMLNACPTLQVLVTSRAPLNLSAEHELPVAPLALPAEDSSRDGIAASPAVSLFLERSLMPESAVTDESAITIAAICRRIDGLPLAIELAAANMRLMAPAELLGRMNRALPLLEDGPRDAAARLQTMRSAIAWSYDLLSPPEQQLLRSLSVFQGGFTLEAAEAIEAGRSTEPFLTLFRSLVNSSLIQRRDTEASPLRFGMLETVREFCIDMLAQHGEAESARDRHLAWCVDQLMPYVSDLWGSPDTVTIHLPREQDNLRSALNWALERGDARSAARIAFGLRAHWKRGGHFLEAEATCDRIASMARPIDPILATAVMHMQSGFAYQLGHFAKTLSLNAEGLRICRERSFLPGMYLHLRSRALVTRWSDGRAALDMITEAIELAKASGNRLDLAFAYHQHAFTYVVYGDIERAEEDLDRIMEILETSAEAEPVRVYALTIATLTAGLRKDFARAERLSREMLALANADDVVECQQAAHRAFGEIALAAGEHQRAAANYQDALRLVYRSALRLWEGFCFADLAAVAHELGDWRRAALLYGAAEANWGYLGIVPGARGTLVSWHHDGSPPAEAMADPLFATAFADGQRLSRAEAYAEAMAVGTGSVEARPRIALLSARQHEVLQLMADGHTNREIAEILFVSKRTIDGHVASILARFGVDTRREAVAMARQHGLLVETPVKSGSGS